MPDFEASPDLLAVGLLGLHMPPDAPMRGASGGSWHGEARKVDIFARLLDGQRVPEAGFTEFDASRTVPLKCQQAFPCGADSRGASSGPRRPTIWQICPLLGNVRVTRAEVQSLA